MSAFLSAAKTRLSLGVLPLLFVLASCPDPVREDLEAEQGPEVPGIPEGETHRAGQRCLACHREGGPSPAFSFAGTVYQREGETAAAGGITVAITDAKGETRQFITNGVGNFYSLTSSWSPTFPLKAELRIDNRSIAMRTEIPREGSCNACHRGTGGQATMPGVFVEARSP